MPADQSCVQHGVPPTLPSTSYLRAYRVGTHKMLLHLVLEGEQRTTCGYNLIKSVAFLPNSQRKLHARR
jgi:hypothetical protein